MFSCYFFNLIIDFLKYKKISSSKNKNTNLLTKNIYIINLKLLGDFFLPKIVKIKKYFFENKLTKFRNFFVNIVFNKSNVRKLALLQKNFLKKFFSIQLLKDEENTNIK